MSDTNFLGKFIITTICPFTNTNKADHRYVNAAGRLVIWRPGEANNLVALKTNNFKTFST